MNRVDPAPCEDLVLTRATEQDQSLVLDILDEAAAWLRRRGIHQWPASFRPSVVLPAIEAGETFLACRRDEIVATVTVDHADPAWSDRPGPALYVHRLACRRTFAGGGAGVLSLLAQRAAVEGRALRLDCVAANARLCRYYEELGFEARGEVEVGGSPGQRSAGEKTTTVRRYEKNVPHRR